jgi:hypothetical protein
VVCVVGGGWNRGPLRIKNTLCFFVGGEKEGGSNGF